MKDLTHWDAKVIFTGLMASLYQRFTGKINTNKSFPHPPEASHLLGGQVPEEENKAGKSPHHPSSRPPAQYRKRNACEEEDVRNRLIIHLRTKQAFML